MTIFVLAPSPTSASKMVNALFAVPSAMLPVGDLRAWTLRENGTLRHLELAPVGSDRRDTAEWISEQLGEGLTVKAMARELHVSVATVRRYLLALELTEQIEAGEWDDLRFGLDGEPEWVELPSEEASAVEISEDAAGTHCEPEGTTEAELAEALFASIERSEAARTSR